MQTDNLGYAWDTERTRQQGLPKTPKTWQFMQACMYALPVKVTEEVVLHTIRGTQGAREVHTLHAHIQLWKG